MSFIKDEPVIVDAVDDTVCLDCPTSTSPTFLLLAMDGFQTRVRNHNHVVFTEIRLGEFFDLGVGTVIHEHLQFTICVFLLQSCQSIFIISSSIMLDRESRTNLNLLLPLHQSNWRHNDKSGIWLWIIRHDQRHSLYRLSHSHLIT